MSELTHDALEATRARAREPVPTAADETRHNDWVRAAANDRDALLAALDEARAALTPRPCVMTHTAPYDFAACETHDTTFRLGDRCKFYGRDPLEVIYEEADVQRCRAVRAEMERDLALDERDAVMALAAAADALAPPRTKTTEE